jgi:hypothetical protein
MLLLTSDPNYIADPYINTDTTQHNTATVQPFYSKFKYADSVRITNAGTNSKSLCSHFQSKQSQSNG